MIDYTFYALSIREKARLIIAIVVCALLVSVLFFDNFILVLALPVLYKLIKMKYCKYLMNRRKSELNLQFRDCLYSLAASFSSGRHMRDAIEAAYSSLVNLYGEKSDMASELKNMLLCIDYASQDEILLWRDFADRSGSEDIYSFISVYEACRDTGGNIVSAINKAAMIITEKITIEHEIANQIIQRKYEGTIIGFMPFIMLFFLRLMSSEYIAVMYQSIAGRILMIISLCLIFVALILEERITNIDV